MLAITDLSEVQSVKIAVLCGGLSNERDVSISSGTGIARALREAGHRVVLVDLFLGYTKPFESADELFTESGENDPFIVGETAPDLAQVRAMRPGQGKVGPQVLEICRQADIVFLALHGEEGENGKVQALLDLYGIRYTGSGYLGSAIAMNKGLTKSLLKEAGIAVPGGIVLQKGEKPAELPEFPCVVKPVSGGSSVGTTIVQNEAEFKAALDLSFAYEDSAIIEGFVSGRELTVGVIDGKAMPVIEIRPKNGFYDYKNKYQPGLTEELCPAPLTPEETVQVQRLAEQVFTVLKLDAYGRMDFILDAKGRFFCLEANTLPGMTPTSLVPQMGAAMGLSYAQLCEKLIDASVKRYEREAAE